jgi:hypothetical protein
MTILVATFVSFLSLCLVRLLLPPLSVPLLLCPSVLHRFSLFRQAEFDTFQTKEFSCTGSLVAAFADCFVVPTSVAADSLDVSLLFLKVWIVVVVHS